MSGDFYNEGVRVIVTDDGEIAATRHVINEDGDVVRQHAGNTEGYDGEIPEPEIVRVNNELIDNLKKIEINHYEYLDEKSREADYDSVILQIQNEMDTQEDYIPPTKNNDGWSR